MTSPFDLDLSHGRLRIGYRSPGLTQCLDADGKMALCRELGMTVIEPQMNALEITEPAMAADLREAASRAGVDMNTMGALLPFTDPKAGEAMAKATDLTIDCARAAGVDYVFTLVPPPPERVPQSEAWMLAVDNIRRLADRFAAAGIRLALEPEWFVQSVERLRRMLRDVGDERVFVNFDPTNFYLGGSDPLEIFEDFDRRILSGHIKDAVYRSERRDEVPVGEGELDYDRILAHLLQRGAPMTLFIEHCTSPDQVRAAARHIAAVLERLGRGPAAAATSG